MNYCLKKLLNIVIKWTLMSFKKNGYNLYKNIISKELTNFLYSYLNTKKEVYFTFQKLKRISPYNLDWGAIGDQAVPGTYNAYGDIAMDNLLQILQPVIEEKTKLKFQLERKAASNLD